MPTKKGTIKKEAPEGFLAPCFITLGFFQPFKVLQFECVAIQHGWNRSIYFFGSVGREITKQQLARLQGSFLGSVFSPLKSNRFVIHRVGCFGIIY